MLTNCTQPRENIRGWRWEDSVTLSNLSVDKWTTSVKVFEVFKLMPTSLLLPRWEVMTENVQAERCVACLYTLVLRRLKRKGSWGFGSNWVKQWNQSGLCGEILSQKQNNKNLQLVDSMLSPKGLQNYIQTSKETTNQRKTKSSISSCGRSNHIRNSEHSVHTTYRVSWNNKLAAYCKGCIWKNREKKSNWTAT